MLKKITSNTSKKKTVKKDLNFFDLSSSEKRRIVEKAARLSAQDQQKLLKEYERKFGALQTNTCK
ncbi:MAG: hypothetical protein ACD_7C00063G0007 [uncultured bacterium]|nr:MAG: hypothetical protein ACD_7C00063G0007 [uncultured bacterium]HBR79077.1 hypothetical protein [Candidatus Moranbacteria bacterium]